MKKFANFLFKNKFEKKGNLSELSSLITMMNSEIKIQKIHSTDIPISDRLFNDIFENILIKHINTRCEELSFTSSIFQDKDNNTYIKVYGDSNMIIEDSHFILFKNLESLNENLDIQSDLLFSEADIYLIINEYLKFLEINNKNVYQFILPIIKKSKINKIKDLKFLITQILGEELVFTKI